MLKLVLNYTIAFFMWLVLGRAILSLFTRDLNNPIYAIFYRATEPMHRIARKIFPYGTTIFIIVFLVILRILVVKYL